MIAKDLNDLNSLKNTEKKTKNCATAGINNTQYSGDYDYYTETKKEILGQRHYFEFRDDSMFNSLKKVDPISEEDHNFGIPQSKYYANENPVIKNKAEQDFKSKKAIDETESDEFLFDDAFYPITEFEDYDDLSLFDSNHSNNVAMTDKNNKLGKEYDWFIDGLDSFQDGLSNDVVWNEVDTDVEVPKEERAYQIAESTCQSIHWTEKSKIDLLAQIFIANGWSLNRNRLLKEIKLGMSYEMVKLAVKIRELWNKHAEFKVGYYKGWISDVHKNVEWRFCHNLISSYSSLPDEDEIESYLLELFDGWYCSDLLKKIFLTFYDYINYRTTSNIPFDMLPNIPFEDIPNKRFLY